MTAYYNEHDPFAAAWLRQLIEYGHIAPGIVDERSIEDVTPADLDGFTQCHFFAGIGVWSYALRAAGWSDDTPIWTGSCPCQPFSAAGKGIGFADERHLWPAFHWLIQQCRPAVVAGEQVASKDGLAWIELVSADLEIQEYAFAAVDMCAAGIGAPHIRQRLYWMAYAASGGSWSGLRDSRPAGQWGNIAADGSRLIRLDDTVGTRLEGFGGGYSSEIGRNGTPGPVATAGEFGGMADANGGNAGTERLQRSGEQRQQPEDGRRGIMAPGGMADAAGTGREMAVLAGIDGDAAPGIRQANGPGSNGSSVRTSPTNGHWRNADWLHCRDGRWRAVEPGTFPLAHGTPARVGRLRGYGNAIVAQNAQVFIETMMDIL